MKKMKKTSAMFPGDLGILAALGLYTKPYT
jgi:hypothetical protein